MTETKATNQTTLPEGYKLHWYEIQAVLGQGNFGITYLAHDHNLDQLVAIKEYLPLEFATRDLGNSTIHPLTQKHDEIYHWGLERFMVEAKTLARFKHPNIVRVYSVFGHNNTTYMVMEYEQGEDLASVFKRGELKSESELRAILLPLLDGLQLIHEAGFIHRDIKPSNVYIREDGSPVLLDFGSARQALGGKTRALTTLVTPGYAPFEQYQDSEQHQGPWTDIYALGATIYFGVTGEPPINALIRGRARLSNVPDPYEPATEAGINRYSVNFLAAIDQALMFKEADRPQSVREWRRMLLGELPVPSAHEAPSIATEPFVGEETLEPIRAEPDRFPEWPEPETGIGTRRSQRRGVRTVGILAVVVVAATIGALLATQLDLFRKEQTRPGPVAESAAKEDLMQLEQLRIEEENRGQLVELAAEKEERALRTQIEQQEQEIIQQERLEPQQQEPYSRQEEIRRSEAEAWQLPERIQTTRALIRAVEARVARGRHKADEVNAREHASDLYRKAEDWEDDSQERIGQAALLEEESQYAEALSTMRQAIASLDRAYDTYLQAHATAIKLNQGAEIAEIEADPLADRKALNQLIYNFKWAYQQKDLAKLQRISEMSPARLSFLQNIFGQYRTIEVSISNLLFNAGQDHASAVVSIDNLINDNGGRVTPPAGWKHSRIVVRKKGNEWGKIIW